jgi:hypothetical protein
MEETWGIQLVGIADGMVFFICGWVPPNCSTILSQVE